MTHDTLTRRDFLKATGTLVVTFTLPATAAAAAAPAPAAKSVSPQEVNGFIAIDDRGQVTVYSGKVDLGTGIQTAMAQIAAEELCVPLDRVHVVQGDTALTPDQGTTWGSLSIQIGGMQIRQACATAREALLGQGAQTLGVDRARVHARDGAVMVLGSERAVPYARLVGGKTLEMKVDAKAPTKDPAQYTVVGQPVPRVDIPAKVTGRFTYIQDYKRKGMLHARVVRPAGLHATLESYDDSAARRIPGYVATVRKGSFLAAVAKSEWGAMRCADAIRAHWSDWQGLPDKAKLWDHVRNTKAVSEEVLQKAGDVTKGGGARTLSATYDFAVHTHGSMGPSCAVAEMRDGKLTVWTASQATHLLRKQLAHMLSMKPEDVRCVYIEGSGCYGRNGHEDAAADAALLARELGKPVRVQWSRAEEHGWDPKGPPTLLDHKAALDAAGNVVAWESVVHIPNRPKGFEVTLVAAEHAGLPKDSAFPGNIHQSLAIPYSFPNIQAKARWLESTPFKPSWIRTPGRMQNTYANESFVDECAAAAGVDPLEFRRRNLKDARGLDLLDRLAKLASWQPRKAAAKPSGDIVRGRGLSYTKYELVRTYVGAVADVAVNVRTGEVRVERFYVAHDCGQIINPDGLRNQIEGNVVQTVSRTLLEDLQWNGATVTSLDWMSYPILRFPAVPDVVMELIDRPNEKPWGAGEPAAAVVPSAIANAIYDATGARLRSVPFTPEKVKAALRPA